MNSKFDEIIKKSRPVDNELMRVLFNNNIPLAQEMLEIILQRNDFTIESVTIEKVIPSLATHSIRLDILAIDKENNYFNIEVQNTDEKDLLERSRYYTGMIDTKKFEKGENYKNLTDTYIIFITSFDPFGDNSPIDEIEQSFKYSKKRISDGSHRIFVNGNNKDTSTALGRLMHDLQCSDPNKIKTKELKKSVEYYKNTERGRLKMCEELQKIVDEESQKRIEEQNQKHEQEKRESVIIMLKKKMSIEDIMEIQKVTKEYILQVAKEENI